MKTPFGDLDIQVVEQGVHKIEKSLFGVVCQDETGFYKGEIFIIDAKYSEKIEETVRNAARDCETFEEFVDDVLVLSKKWKAVVQVRFNFDL
jgi:hypothetical protein